MSWVHTWAENSPQWISTSPAWVQGVEVSGLAGSGFGVRRSDDEEAIMLVLKSWLFLMGLYHGKR